MAVVTDVNLVLAAAQAAAVNGVVRVRLRNPHPIEWDTIKDSRGFRRVPRDNGPMQHYVDYALAQLQVVEGKNAITFYERVAVRRPPSPCAAVIVLINGELVQDGSISPVTEERLQLVGSVETLWSWTKPTKRKDPDFVPTVTFFNLGMVYDRVNNKNKFITIESRGPVINDSNFNKYIPMGIEFETRDEALFYSVLRQGLVTQLPIEEEPKEKEVELND